MPMGSLKYNHSYEELANLIETMRNKLQENKL
jgi:hypothetical protein